MSWDRWDSWEVARENSETSPRESRFREDFGPGALWGAAFSSERNFLKRPIGEGTWPKANEEEEGGAGG